MPGHNGRSECSEFEITGRPRSEHAGLMAGPSDDQVRSLMDRASIMTTRLDQQLSRRDGRFARYFAMAVASHCDDSVSRDLRTVDRNGMSEARFERGRVAFSTVYPGDPFEMVHRLGLVTSIFDGLNDASTKEAVRAAQQVVRVARRRVADARPAD